MKNILTKNVLLLIFIGIITSSCFTKEIINFGMINNSSKTIYDGISLTHPDISLKKINKPVSKTFPGQQQSKSLSNFKYNTTLQIFIFDANVIENEPWDTIVKYNKFLKRYQFTKSELESMGGNIVYDGN